MNKHRLATRLYVLRNHLGLTRAELHGLVILGSMLLGGLLIRDLRQRIPAIDPATYIKLEEDFRARSWRTPDPEPIGPVLPLPPEPVPALLSMTGLDLNSATGTQLEGLPRVGPKTAERILDFRLKNGPFRNVDDLLLIPGIGPATLERLRPLVTVRPANRASEMGSP